MLNILSNERKISMIENLKWTKNNISWNYGDSNINISIDKIFIATPMKKKKVICVKTGVNFNEEIVYFYDYNGVLILLYSIPEEKVKWFHEEKMMSCVVPGLNQAMHIDEINHIYILFENRGVRVIKSSGEVVCDCFTNDNVICKYLSQVDNKPIVVCDGDTEDEYGRFRINYYINEDMKLLEKGEIIS